MERLAAEVESGGSDRSVFEEINALGTSIAQQESHNAELRMAAARREEEERIARQRELEAALERVRQEEAFRVQQQQQAEAVLREERMRREEAERLRRDEVELSARRIDEARRQAEERARQIAATPVVDPETVRLQKIEELISRKDYAGVMPLFKNKQEAEAKKTSIPRSDVMTFVGAMRVFKW
jgi:hypothetical protein